MAKQRMKSASDIYAQGARIDRLIVEAWPASEKRLHKTREIEHRYLMNIKDKLGDLRKYSDKKVARAVYMGFSKG